MAELDFMMLFSQSIFLRSSHVEEDFQQQLQQIVAQVSKTDCVTATFVLARGD